MKRFFSAYHTSLEVKKIIRTNKKQLMQEAKTEIEVPIPVSPKLGPIKVSDVKVEQKTYRWCSCGLSLTQPICDDSHVGTKFKPYRFIVQEYEKDLYLCGCKYTKDKPFCDGETCKQLKK